MKHCPLILVLSLIYPMARGAESTDSVQTTRVMQSSERGTAVVLLPGPRHAAKPEVTPKKPDTEETKPAVPAREPVESSIYFPKLIGIWKLPDARRILGQPIRHRPSLDTDKTVTGQIYAFQDPTNRYKEVELEFGQDDGALRGVFMYPAQMTWNECRRLWGMNVNATEAGKGRTFYSYNNRHLDVLVDPDGKVISLGLY